MPLDKRLGACYIIGVKTKGEKMANVVKLNIPASTGINLSEFCSKKMFCPVTKQIENVYAIPLDLIDEEVHNPGRINGTDHSNSHQIYDDLITNPEGQIEPTCAKFNKSTGKFRLIYGYNRLWAFKMARKTGFNIANTSNYEMWVRIHTGTKVSEITQQIRENGNKPPAKPATREDMVFQLQRLISVGGLDDDANDLSFDCMSDEIQRDVAQKWMKTNVPLWGGRKFRGLWNAYCASGQATASNFKNWLKSDMSSYFINNNDEGITKEVVVEQMGRDFIKSGDIFNIKSDEEQFTLAVYFTTQNNAYNAAALLVNISRKKFKEKPSRIVVVQAVNGVTSNKIENQRKSKVEDLSEWHEHMKQVVDKIYWVPQSRSEISKHYNSGDWARTDNF